LGEADIILCILWPKKKNEIVGISLTLSGISKCKDVSSKRQETLHTSSNLYLTMPIGIGDTYQKFNTNMIKVHLIVHNLLITKNKEFNNVTIPTLFGTGKQVYLVAFETNR
jgi:hypothetical protein